MVRRDRGKIRIDVLGDSQMDIISRKRGDVVILDLKGNLGITGMEGVTLHKKVKGEIGEGGTNFLLNFADVAFMDSTGVGELLASFVSIRNRGGKIKLESLPPKILFLFEVTGIIGLFEKFDDEEAAVRSFREAKPADK